METIERVEIIDRADAKPISDRSWPHSIRLTGLMWDVACRYLLGGLSRAEYLQELAILSARYRAVVGETSPGSVGNTLGSLEVSLNGY